MEYVYGALLLHSAGSEIDEEKLKKVLEGAGLKPDESRLKALVSSMKGVNIEEVIKNAASVPAAAPAAAGAKHEEKKESKKKEEKKDEKEAAASEEDALAGLSSLFG
ncbi:MAG: 50S ribosomal protein P1 [Thermoplasmataceae archaeon]|jgi:large subunit ribosomal protein L12|nr:50S ribosomal protein P1 [Candidatus Thermoplasmatota archaeon]MCL5439975.1 50S ribosomal protein P1 [Candidatus Thermoplasmatota archaeon]